LSSGLRFNVEKTRWIYIFINGITETKIWIYRFWLKPMVGLIFWNGLKPVPIHKPIWTSFESWWFF
jgi:hypothetical protein